MSERERERKREKRERERERRGGGGGGMKERVNPLISNRSDSIIQKKRHIYTSYVKASHL